MANNDLIIAQGYPQRDLPVPVTGVIPTTVRLSRYAEQMVQVTGGGGLHSLADEGSLFVATNPTFGTAISGTTAPTSFSATVALLSMYNSQTATTSPSKRIYPAWIAVEVRTVGTAGTKVQFVMNADAGNRYSSGGTALTAVNPNMDSSAASIATLNFGALTASAASSQVRRIKHGQIRPVIQVTGDVYLFVFGQAQAPHPGAEISGTNAQVIPVHCPPVCLGPNQSLLLHEVQPSQTAAATYEISMAWWER